MTLPNKKEAFDLLVDHNCGGLCPCNECEIARQVLGNLIFEDGTPVEIYENPEGTYVNDLDTRTNN